MRADCESGWLLKVVDLLTLNCDRYRLVRTMTEQIQQEHADLAKACAARNADAVAELMTEHVVNTRDRIEEALTKER